MDVFQLSCILIAGCLTGRITTRCTSYTIPAMKERIHIVWFKRDLRIHDHAPLHVAARRGKVLPLYVVEADYWQLPDASARHWRFIRQSLHELNTTLSRLGQPLVKMQGDMLTALDTLRERFDIAGLYSHQESGNLWTFARDRQVAQWCAQHGVEWQEFQPYGVFRHLQDQGSWADKREHFMTQERLPAPARFAPLQTRIAQSGLPDSLGSVLENEENRHCQSGGRNQALMLLGSFMRERGQHYPQEMSSRLSPHLAYGTLSLREVTHKLRNTLESAELDANRKRSLRAFDTRLHWHCHFIQKLETGPRFETDNMLAVFDGLRENDFNPAYFEAWRNGTTGFPLIDASMRSLRQTGWINFRMRAMLMSFAAHQLWLHWTKPAWHLAQCFTDYEPGIHYPQVQMQSGTTGINALRLYNPIKQSHDQDPQGVFIRHWLPELADTPAEYIHTPWLMPYSVQKQYGCVIGVDYPEPIVDHMAAVRQARAKFSELRRHHPELREQAQALNEKHGSRKKQPKHQLAASEDPSSQLKLF